MILIPVYCMYFIDINKSYISNTKTRTIYRSVDLISEYYTNTQFFTKMCTFMDIYNYFFRDLTINQVPICRTTLRNFRQIPYFRSIFKIGKFGTIRDSVIMLTSNACKYPQQGQIHNIVLPVPINYRSSNTLK